MYVAATTSRLFSLQKLRRIEFPPIKQILCRFAQIARYPRVLIAFRDLHFFGCFYVVAFGGHCFAFTEDEGVARRMGFSFAFAC